MHVILVRFWQAAVRAMAAIVLLMAVASPAFAEIGCAEDTAVHMQREASISAADDHETVTEQGRESKRDDKGAPIGHCAFNHGHCAGIPLSSASQTRMALPVIKFDFHKYQPLAATLLDTPERPPAA